jgi:hypothetical protein
MDFVSKNEFENNDIKKRLLEEDSVCKRKLVFFSVDAKN